MWINISSIVNRRVRNERGKGCPTILSTSSELYFNSSKYFLAVLVLSSITLLLIFSSVGMAVKKNDYHNDRWMWQCSCLSSNKRFGSRIFRSAALGGGILG